MRVAERTSGEKRRCARESPLHCYDDLAADDPGITSFSENMSGGHACSATFLVEADGLKQLADTLDGTVRSPFTPEANGVLLLPHAFIFVRD